MTLLDALITPESFGAAGPPPGSPVPDSIVDKLMEDAILLGLYVHSRVKNKYGFPVLQIYGDIDWQNKAALADAVQTLSTRYPVFIDVIRKTGTGDLEFTLRGKA